MKLDHEIKISECLNETYMVFKFILHSFEIDKNEEPMTISSFWKANNPEVCALLYLYSMETPFF